MENDTYAPRGSDYWTYGLPDYKEEDNATGETIAYHICNNPEIVAGMDIATAAGMIDSKWFDLCFQGLWMYYDPDLMNHVLFLSRHRNGQYVYPTALPHSSVMAGVPMIRPKAPQTLGVTTPAHQSWGWVPRSVCRGYR